MPHRVFNIDEVAHYLHLSRKDMDTLVKRQEVPVERQGERLVFRKREIDAWASQRVLGLSGTRLTDYHRAATVKVHPVSPRRAILPELLTRDRIQPALAARTKSSVLRDMVTLADASGLVNDPRDLLAGLEERERLCSTAMPGGVALLHPRHHDPYLFSDSLIAVARSIHPLHCGALDGGATDIFFLLCCQDDRLHLHTLARLCTLMHQTGMLTAIRAAGTANEILAACLGAEEEVIGHL